MSQNMGWAGARVDEVRFVIRDGFTEAYVLVHALGDAPLGTQGWHYKVFPKEMAVADILASRDFLDHVLWPLKAPGE